MIESLRLFKSEGVVLATTTGVSSFLGVWGTGLVSCFSSTGLTSLTGCTGTFLTGGFTETVLTTDLLASGFSPVITERLN